MLGRVVIVYEALFNHSHALCTGLRDVFTQFFQPSEGLDNYMELIQRHMFLIVEGENTSRKATQTRERTCKPPQPESFLPAGNWTQNLTMQRQHVSHDIIYHRGPLGCLSSTEVDQKIKVQSGHAGPLIRNFSYVSSCSIYTVYILLLRKSVVCEGSGPQQWAARQFGHVFRVYEKTIDVKQRSPNVFLSFWWSQLFPHSGQKNICFSNGV